MKKRLGLKAFEEKQKLAIGKVKKIEYQVLAYGITYFVGGSSGAIGSTSNINIRGVG